MARRNHSAKFKRKAAQLAQQTGVTKKRVTRWRDGTMPLRWVSSSILQAARGRRRVRGYRDMKLLLSARSRTAMAAPRAQLDVAYDIQRSGLTLRHRSTRFRRLPTRQF